MLRRTFLAALFAATALPAWPAAAGTGFVEYRPGVIKDALASGKTVFVDFSATWCVTCKAQARVIDELLGDNPDYAEAMTFVRVDWDTYSNAPVARDRNIPRRSTLIMLRGQEELGRIVAGTSKAQIKALLDKGR